MAAPRPDQQPVQYTALALPTEQHLTSASWPGRGLQTSHQEVYEQRRSEVQVQPWYLISQSAYGRWHILYEEYQPLQKGGADGPRHRSRPGLDIRLAVVTGDG
jgi:hypothetical protein